jgi:hypothetical protein
MMGCNHATPRPYHLCCGSHTRLPGGKGTSMRARTVLRERFGQPDVSIRIPFATSGEGWKVIHLGLAFFGPGNDIKNAQAGMTATSHYASLSLASTAPAFRATLTQMNAVISRLVSKIVLAPMNPRISGPCHITQAGVAKPSAQHPSRGTSSQQQRGTSTPARPSSLGNAAPHLPPT